VRKDTVDNFLKITKKAGLDVSPIGRTIPLTEHLIEVI
jgi:hypothetical protein